MGSSVPLELDTERWLTDPNLSLCKPATRGIWMDLICSMHNRDRCGVVSGAVTDLSRLARCLPGELRSAISDLRAHDVAEVTEQNGNVTLTNRRMWRVHKDRTDNQLRQARYRQRQCGEPPNNGHAAEDEGVAPHVVVSQNNSSSPQNGEESSDVRMVFLYWQEVMNHPNSKLTIDRLAKIRARLREGFGVGQIKKAIDGCKSSTFHMGENDQAKVYDDIELICRKGSAIEKFIGFTNRVKHIVGNPDSEEQKYEHLIER